MSDDLTREEELRLREYAEAGSLCRSYEQLSRTSLAIYIAFSAAVIAVIVNPGTELYARITLEVIGLVVTLFTLNVLTRVRLFYHAYVKRAKEIETQLGMDVYHRWNQAISDTLTIRNKAAMLLIITAFGLYFFAILALDIRCLVEHK